jgi:hypothetical protein
MQEIVQPVEPELLIKANEVVGKNRGKDPTISIIVALADHYPSKQLIATTYRLQAMQKLVLSGHGPAWIMNVKGKKYKLVNEAMFRAAAKAPLRYNPESPIGDMAFDAHEFLQAALAESSPEGTA